MRLFKRQIRRNDDAIGTSRKVAAAVLDIFFVNLQLRIARKLSENIIVAKGDERVSRTSASGKDDKGK